MSFPSSCDKLLEDPKVFLNGFRDEDHFPESCGAGTESFAGVLGQCTTLAHLNLGDLETLLRF
jgi:hypothetical protein